MLGAANSMVEAVCPVDQESRTIAVSETVVGGGREGAIDPRYRGETQRCSDWCSVKNKRSATGNRRQLQGRRDGEDIARNSGRDSFRVGHRQVDTPEDVWVGFGVAGYREVQRLDPCHRSELRVRVNVVVQRHFPTEGGSGEVTILCVRGCAFKCRV